MSSSSNKPGPAVLLLGVLGLAYPFLVYLSLDRVPAGALVPVALALAAGRLVITRKTPAARALAPALGLVLAGLLILAFTDTETALLAYPVTMNLGMAAAFGLSLLRPPCLIECFALLADSTPSDQARAYMRRVCLVWCLFLTANGGISLLTVLSGDRVIWALYNGLISYLLMGGLFLGEYLVRRRVQSREQAS